MRSCRDLIKTCHANSLHGPPVQAATTGYTLPCRREPILESAHYRRAVDAHVLKHAHRSSGSHCSAKLGEG